MYPFVLGLHNTLRWGVLLAAAYLLVLVVAGLTGRRSWTRRESVAASVYTSFMYLQLLIGLSLYIGVSPYMQAILDHFGEAMNSGETRFFAVEHVTGMLLAVLFAHLGNLLYRRQATDAGRYRVAGLWFGLSLLCVLALIPWWRPLLRL